MLNTALLEALVLTLAAETGQRSMGRIGCTGTWNSVCVGS